MDYPEPKHREELYKTIRENISMVRQMEKRDKKKMRLAKRRDAKRKINLA